MEKYTGLEVAIIGIAGKFPEAPDLDHFWENIRAGKESIRFFTEEELVEAGESLTTLENPHYVKACSYMKDKGHFDADFFGYTPDEASLMDPQTRLFHECAWNALENAGVVPGENGQKIGLFAGTSNNMNWEVYARLKNGDGKVDALTAEQVSSSRYMVSRVAHKLNLTGPAVYVDTACSTSLVALHQAYNSLLLGDCNIALSGGVTVHNRSHKGYHHIDGMIYSRDGHCRTFDEEASGTVEGEGAGIVVLKKLKNAIEDEDHIWAVLKGSAINNDGDNKVAYTAPSVEGQMTAIMAAQKWAKVTPETIQFIEAHGTATTLGDPIEIEALKRVFGHETGHTVAINSVKSNLGHTRAAAGIAGLLKTILGLYHQEIPPSPNFNRPNPKIDFQNSPFEVNTKVLPWERHQSPRRAGVSSFGIGGTNAHVIVEEAPSRVNETGEGRQVLPVSAKSEAALQRNLERIGAYLEQNPDIFLGDVAFTLQQGRTHFQHRASIVCNNVSEAISELATFQHTRKVHPQKGKPFTKIFMFTGQGAQYHQMYGDLYQESEIFRSSADACFQILQQSHQLDLKSILFGGAPGEEGKINKTAFTQPAIFVMEYALAQYLSTQGIKPDLMIGHSIGEYVAACIAGVFSLEDAIRIVVKRGALMQRAPEGTMLSVSATKEQVENYLDQFSTVDMAAVNSSSLVVVSGPDQPITELHKILERDGVKSKKLVTSHAFHSQLMDGILEEFREVLKHVSFAAPQLPIVTNITGKVAAGDDLISPEYWVKQLRGTVDFNTGIETCLTKSNPLFIEVGPGRALSTFVKAHESRSEEPAISLVKGAKATENDVDYLFRGLGDLWKAGLELDWDKLNAGPKGKIIPLPTYAFEPTVFPVEVNAGDLLKTSTSHSIESSFYAPSWKLYQHVNLNEQKSNDEITLIFDNTSTTWPSDQNIIVTPGSHFEAIDKRHIQINPANTSDYARLFKLLDEEHRLPRRIVHAWANSIQASEVDFEQRLYSLNYLMKAFKPYNLKDPELAVLTSSLFSVMEGEQVNNPYQAMVSGLLKVITLEYPGLKTRLLDVESDSTDQAIQEQVYKSFYDESRHATLAWRGGIGFVQQFERVKPKTEKQNISTGCVYVITGGLGKLGFNLARHLLIHFQAKVVLLGRSPLTGSAEKQERFKNLRSRGEVIYYDLDLTDKFRLQEVLDRVEQEIGEVKGLIHAAGISATQLRKPVEALTSADFEAHFQSKVWASNALVEVFGPKNLDFALLTSSLSSIIGSLGFGAYAAASAYLDCIPAAFGLKNWTSVSLDGLGYGDTSNELISEGDQLRLLEIISANTDHAHLAASVTPLPARIEDWLQNTDVTDIEEDATGPLDVNDLADKLLILLGDFFGKTVTLNDDFFELGGDSLKALTVIGRIQKHLKVDISIEDFFRYTSIGELSKFLENALDESPQTNYQPIPKASVATQYPLSSAQKRLYYLFELDPDSISYNQPKVLKLFGPLDVDKLRESFQKLGETHEILRTAYQVVDGEPHQVVNSAFELPFQQITCSEEEARQLIAREVRPFDLNRGEVFRVTLLKIEANYHVLLVDLHHIVTDGFSHAFLLNDFVRLYTGEEINTPEITYKDYSCWQQSEDYKESISDQLTYWTSVFEAVPESLELPSDRERSPQQQFNGGTYEFEIGEQELQWLQKIADEEQTTLYVVTLTLYLVLLHKLSGQQDITVGTPIAGRNHPDLEHVVGMLVNTLALRNSIDPDRSFRDLVAAVHQETMTCFKHQDLPFEQLIEALNVGHESGKNPLFDVAFSFQNFEQGQLALPNITLAPFDYNQQVTKFDLNLIVVGTSDKMTLNFEYATALFNESTVASFADYLGRLLREFIASENSSIGAISLINQPEKDFILKEFNNTCAVYPGDQTIVRLFEGQATQKPDHVVLTTGDQSYTYAELDRKATAFAAWIHGRIGAAFQTIPVLSDRSAEAVVAFLGILKSGNAYAPIDADFPKNRILELIASLDSNIILTQAAHQDLVPKDVEVLVIDDARKAPQFPDDFQSYQGKASDLAYVMYTSGSTGKPKSVGVSQQNVIRLIRQTNYLDFSKGLRILQTGAPAFDATTYEIWGALLNAGYLHITSKETLLDTELLEQVIIENKINTVFMTTGLFNVHAKENPSLFKYLDHLMVGGEVANIQYFLRVRDENPELDLCNIYGPTENTTFTLYHTLLPELNYETGIPIGVPIGNSRAYVLDSHQNLQLQGVAGELYVAGDGVAIGYLNDENLTQERFLPDPFFPGERMYKTGDRAVLNHQGQIEFKGRIDNQLKINGFRVELSEIEHHLLEHLAVKEALVIASNDESNKGLVAYFVTEQGHEVTVATLKEYLSKRLPKYMVPTFFQPVSHMPLALNGKFDRKALPKVELLAESSYVAPATATEHQLVSLWAKVLKQPASAIGVQDHFSDLGGHSLKATSLVNLIRKECQVELSLRDFLKNNTIRAIAEVVEAKEHNAFEQIPRAPSRECYVLSSAQKRLYFLQQFDPESTTYNVTNVLELKGELDEDRLEEAFRQLIDRHEVLRTACREEGDAGIQVVCDMLPFKLEVSEDSDLSTEIKHFTRPFQLSEPPLFRVKLIRRASAHHWLLIDMHHIVTDGLSQGIFIKELAALYAQKNVAPLAIQYKDFAEWQQSETQQMRLVDQRKYWLERLAAPRPKLDLPLDYKRPDVKSHEGDAVQLLLSADKLAGLQELAQKQESSLFVLLFSIFNVLLSRLSGQRDIIIGTPVSGRTHPDMEPMMGMFTNTLALRNEVDPEASFHDFLEQVNSNCLTAFDRQDFPFEDLIQELNVGRDMGRNPLFDVVFSFQDFSGETVSVDGLDIKPVEVDHRSSKFDMTLYASTKEDQLLLYMEYATTLFEKDSVERFLSCFDQIVEGILEDDQQALQDLKLLKPVEANRVLQLMENSNVAYPEEKTILDLFNEQVRQNPERAAVKHADVAITYTELDIRSNHLARVLRAQDISPNDIVGLLMDRSIDLIVGMLGILKSGGAYLPLDPEYPTDRLAFMVSNSESKLVICGEGLENILTDVPRLGFQQAMETSASDSPLPLINKPEDLAYIIYTSGSTGNPKGVMIEHGNVVRLFRNEGFQFDFDASDTWTLFHSPCFDFSVWEIYGALLFGGKLVIVPKMVARDTSIFRSLLIEERVTVLNQTPSAFYNLIAADQSNEKALALRYVIFGGEALSPGKLKDWHQSHPNTRLINMYGITETTVHVTYKEIGEREIKTDISDIGKPIPTLSLYLLDETLNPVPVGCVGEIYVAGAGVARGYLHNEALTSTRFLTNPRKPNERLYRSGDLARLKSNGVLEYLGRSDFQVKIRGHRIEPGEIETVITDMPGIAQVTVQPREVKGDMHLVAYFTSTEIVDAGDLKNQLKEVLPAYMVPAYFMELDKLPLTINGKLDAKSLPEPQAVQSKTILATVTDQEIQLAEIWEEILELDPGFVSRDANFFDIGGHSINATALVNQVKARLSITISIREVFEKPILRDLADLISTKGWIGEAAVADSEELII